jgi:hypothetical protein
MKLPADIAVYAEYSDSRKPVVAGWNARVFNQVQIQEGSNLQLDRTNGTITARTGLYHITGSSQVTYGDYGELEPGLPKGEGWPTLVVPNGGYCRLRYAKDVNCKNEQAIVVGTISNANMLPSMIDTILDVPEQAELVLEHQVGAKVAGIYLQDNAVNSRWHIFAQISLRRIGDSATARQQSSLCRAFNAALGPKFFDRFQARIDGAMR